MDAIEGLVEKSKWKNVVKNVKLGGIELFLIRGERRGRVKGVFDYQRVVLLMSLCGVGRVRGGVEKALAETQQRT